VTWHQGDVAAFQVRNGGVEVIGDERTASASRVLLVDAGAPKPNMKKW
jgi:hypothetical protein